MSMKLVTGAAFKLYCGTGMGYTGTALANREWKILKEWSVSI